MDFLHRFYLQPCFAQNGGGALRCVKRAAECGEGGGDGSDLTLIRIPHGDEQSFVRPNPVARGDQSFVECFLHGWGNAQHLAG